MMATHREDKDGRVIVEADPNDPKDRLRQIESEARKGKDLSKYTKAELIGLIEEMQKGVPKR